MVSSRDKSDTTDSFNKHDCECVTTTKEHHREHKEIYHKANRANDESLFCSQCSYFAIHERDLNRHVLQMHVTDVEEIFHCNKCEYSTQYQNKLDDHINTTHLQQQSRIFYSKRGANKQKIKEKSNERISTSDKPIKCTYCDYKTTIIEDLRSHKRKHEQAKPRHPFPSFTTASKPLNTENEAKNHEETLRCSKQSGYTELSGIPPDLGEKKIFNL